ncbi:MAG TPA: class II aldolase/adducin family protein [candidate division Zixibacteria bacterium]|nr:class II aldolase/adducin family protein [candidate division Zixibacteria bacterium]
MTAKLPAFDSPELDPLKEKLVTACRILDREGITDGYGHVSVRVPGADAFLTIANVSPGCATVDRLVLQDFEGNRLGGSGTPPNEWPIHACILKARPDVVSVAHTHSKWSTIFSVLPIKLRPLHHYGKFLPPEGPPVYQGAGLVRTLERGEALARALGSAPAVLMRAHGDAVVGESIEQVVERTTRLALLGEWNHLALLHGEPRYLTKEELEVYNADQRFPMRGWEYFVSRLSGRS